MSLLWDVALAFSLNAVLGAVAWRRGTVSRSGFIGGVIVGSAIFVAGGFGAWIALVGFFILGTAATRLGYARKAAAGLAQEDRGRRGTKHALANCGTGLALSLMMPFWGHSALAVGLVAAFATAASDTLGSEVGQLYGRRPFLLTTFRRVEAGTEGAVSVEGTLAGVVGSALMGGIGAVTGLYGTLGIILVIVAAFVGTTFESYLGAIWGQDAKIGNETMNFLNTVVGALVGVVGAILLL